MLGSSEVVNLVTSLLALLVVFSYSLCRSFVTVRCVKVRKEDEKVVSDERRLWSMKLSSSKHTHTHLTGNKEIELR